MNLSYWEIKSWFTNIDFTIIGSGIVGLSTALALKEKYPMATITILEKGVLPQGASTKNAGFACFGSLTEILDDLQHHNEQEVYQLVEKRWNGLHLLRQHLGDKAIDFKQFGAYELFTDHQEFEACFAKKETINQLLKPIFKSDVFSSVDQKFNFSNIINKLVFNQFEGQIDTGKMMVSLTDLALQSGVKILNNITVEDFVDNGNDVEIKTNITTFKTGKLLVTTNGFANQLLKEDVQPARAQILITKPIENLAIRGTFHLDKGYYYFRNIDNRILLGGGRNLDFKAEETTEFGMTNLVNDKLTALLQNTILPNHKFEIEQRWSGIMGVGFQKKPIIKQISDNVSCGVRLGGMGIAIGFLVGEELADLVD